MAEFELIQERNVSGTGVLRVPSDVRKRRLCVLYASVIRRPKSEYLNLNYIPPRSRYGFLTFLRNGYVIGEGSIEFPRQSFDTVSDITSQNLIAIKCMYAGVLQSFVNLATAHGLPVVSVVDLIQDYEYLDLGWDEVRVRCYADTALNLRLYSFPHDSCNPDRDRPRKPPIPEAPPPEIPPGTPIEGIDPPYEDEDNPDTVTNPYPGDQPPEPPSDEPPGQTCKVYEFDLYVKLASNSDYVYFNHYKAYAPITVEVPPTPGFFDSPKLRSRGSTISSGNLPDECGDEVVEPMGAFIGLQNAEMRNFTPATTP